jgi:hypothetical protein
MEDYFQVLYVRGDQYSISQKQSCDIATHSTTIEVITLTIFPLWFFNDALLLTTILKKYLWPKTENLKCLQGWWLLS